MEKECDPRSKLSIASARDPLTDAEVKRLPMENYQAVRNPFQ